MTTTRHDRRLAAVCALLLLACGGDNGADESDASDAQGAVDIEVVGDGQAPPSSDDAVAGTDSEVVPETTSWTQPVADGDWEWLLAHDGVATGAHVYNGPVEPEVPCAANEECTGEGQFCHQGLGTCRQLTTPDAYYEYVRFEVFQPFRLRSVRVQVQITEPTTLTVYVWDDLGGNFLHFDPSTVLASSERAVTTEESETWLELPLDPPVDVDPGRLVYAGVLLEGDASPRLMHDEAQVEVEGKPSGSLVWYSKDIDPTTGTHTIFGGAGGDFLVDLEVQRFDVVQDDAFVFERMDPETTGIPSFSRGAFADVDGDGDIDLMVNGPSLYLNDGAGGFSHAPEAIEGGGGTNGGVFGDYDNDGDPDYLGSGGADVLLRNDDGVFVDVTAESGIDDTQLHTCNGVSAEGHVPTETVTWIDLDRDGWLDAYVTGFICWDDGFPAKDKIFHNNGDGTFTEAGNDTWVAYGQGYGLAARGTAPADYDGDGFTDLLVTNYRLHANLFWHNQGDGTVKEAAEEAGVKGFDKSGYPGTYGHSIGGVWGDFDRDNDLDLFIANLAHPRFLAFSDLATLYRNPGGGAPVMEDVTAEAGIRYQETASDPVAWDYDNDGDLDLLWTCIYADRPSQFYRNEWPATQWTEVTYPSGLVVHDGWGVITGDIDGDGDLDLLSKSAWRNRNPWGRKALQIRPRGKGAGFTNRDGYGARVTVTVDDVDQLQEHVTNRGLSSQDSPWLHFGLGDADAAHVTVHFPASDSLFTFEAVAAGRYSIDEDGALTEE
jgi:hypothetical protein